MPPNEFGIDGLVAAEMKQQIRRRLVTHVAILQHLVTVGLDAHQHRPGRQQPTFFEGLDFQMTQRFAASTIQIVPTQWTDNGGESDEGVAGS